jgi:hypothetical protein
MVTVHKLTGVSAGGAVVDYFFDMEKQRSTGDYYAGPSGEPMECPGAWLGKLAARLGMSGDVTVEQLLHLLDQGSCKVLNALVRRRVCPSVRLRRARGGRRRVGS